MHSSIQPPVRRNLSEDGINQSTIPSLILRHDVDRSPLNALKTAQLEHKLGIKGTYYFRIVPESFDQRIMEKISRLGHEIGYHYEDMDLAARGLKKNNLTPVHRPVCQNFSQGRSFSVGGMKQLNNEVLIDLAFESFCRNLERMRQNFDIKTICMYGSPLSKYDNRIIWDKYNYKELGITGEPYFDIDCREFAYITDTGRRWDGDSVSIRDKIECKNKFKFRTTQDIIKNIENLSSRILITVHPQRWTDRPILWLRELLLRNLKNG